jgi:NAD(P)H dehydrogenase (quinone)
MHSTDSPILITGVPGHVGGVGSAVIASLRRRGLPVRALARRRDEHTDALRVSGVDVVAGDLTRPRDVDAALSGCRRMYFGLSVSPSCLEATATVAAVARAHAEVEALVSISQMTVSQMSLTETTGSPQQRQHWLCEQVLNWAGLPVAARPGSRRDGADRPLTAG